MYLDYRDMCKAQGAKPKSYFGFRSQLHETFARIQALSNPQTEAEFEIAVRKLTGDCK
jgi:hypothetical protein